MAALSRFKGLPQSSRQARPWNPNGLLAKCLLSTAARAHKAALVHTMQRSVLRHELCGNGSTCKSTTTQSNPDDSCNLQPGTRTSVYHRLVAMPNPEAVSQCARGTLQITKSYQYLAGNFNSFFNEREYDQRIILEPDLSATQSLRLWPGPLGSKDCLGASAMANSQLDDSPLARV